MDSRLNNRRQPSTPIDDFSDPEILFLNNNFFKFLMCVLDVTYVFRHFVDVLTFTFYNTLIKSLEN